VSVDGRAFPGLPPRLLALHELRHELLRRSCPQTVRDAVWAHLVRQARAEGGAWTVGCVGVAFPALTTIAASLSARFAGDPSDIQAGMLAGFVAELGSIDLARPRIMLRLRWAAYRAGYAVVREALDAPMPFGNGFTSKQPPPPSGHPDFVLVRAVAEHVITVAEAELIGATRMEGISLADAAAARNMTYQAVKKARLRAEHRLVAYLTATAIDDQDGADDGEVSAAVTNRLAITDAAPTPARGRRSSGSSPSVTSEPALRGVSPAEPSDGVQGCGRAPAADTTAVSGIESPTSSSAPIVSASTPTGWRSGPTTGESRCAA
jgi:hypothetical protein